MVRLILDLHLLLAGRCCANLVSAKGPAQCKSCPLQIFIEQKKLPCVEKHMPVYIELELARKPVNFNRVMHLNLLAKLN